MEDLKSKLLTLPKKPGVYLHKNSQGTIIYVGKAINLYNRVNSYFKGGHDYKTTKLVSEINDFDYIVTKSEKEALILEYNLIKEYDPKYNVIFKDDKSYPYILFRNNDNPYLSVVRLNKKNRLKGKLYGPFPDVSAARHMVEIINKLYPIQKCHKLQNELCLYYHLNECLGYCKYQIDNNIKNDLVNKINNFLNGDVKEVIDDLSKKMNQESELLLFENALRYKNLIDDIKQTIQKQDVQKNINESFDVFNYYVLDGYIAITGLFIRKGRLLYNNHYLESLIGDVSDYVSSYIYEFYKHNDSSYKVYVPKELLVYLKDSDNYDVNTVTRGYKYQLLKQAKLNSCEYLKQNKKMILNKENYYEELKSSFKTLFKHDINRIELFDNSHIAGTNTVAAMVVYENFKANKKEYRLYKLEEGADDLKSMYEVLYRRYYKVLNEELKRPDLIIVDGAKNQIEIAKKVINSLDLNIEIVGLGKNKAHNTAYLMDANFNEIMIDPKSNVFFFLSNMQDEVHRFAINYHKKLRSKAVYKSKLDNIEGLGPKTRIKLLKKFKTISNIEKAELKELETILNKTLANRLYNKLRDN